VLFNVQNYRQLFIDESELLRQVHSIIDDMIINCLAKLRLVLMFFFFSQVENIESVVSMENAIGFNEQKNLFYLL
jgi:hypothetical protein